MSALTLQVNQRGSWRNVVDFDRDARDFVASDLALLAATLGDRTTWRIVEDQNGYKKVVLDDKAIRAASAVPGIPVLLLCDAQLTDDEDLDDILQKNVRLPHLPRINDDLGVGIDGDYLTVEHIYWHPTDGYSIQFRDRVPPQLAMRMLDQGWSEAPNA